MPILSMFYGIVAYMFLRYAKHHIPHFRVEYAEHSAVVAIATGDVLEGSLPENKMKLVQAWLEIHRDEIMADWSLAVGNSN